MCKVFYAPINNKPSNSRCCGRFIRDGRPGVGRGFKPALPLRRKDCIQRTRELIED